MASSRQLEGGRARKPRRFLRIFPAVYISFPPTFPKLRSVGFRSAPKQVMHKKKDDNTSRRRVLKGICVLAFQLSSSPAIQSCATSAKEQRVTGTTQSLVKRKRKIEFTATRTGVLVGSSAGTSARLAAWILQQELSGRCTMKW